MNFGEMIADVNLLVMGALSEDTIMQLLNRAQQQVIEVWDWSFVHANTVINSVSPKTNGSITLAKGSPVVVGTNTTFGLEDVGAFMWIGGLNIAPIPIQAVQGLEALTLSSPWPGQTIVQGQYSLSPLNYMVLNALEVLEVRQITKLDKVSRAALNNSDPARIAQGGAPSTHWCDAPFSPNGSVQIEIWPVPTDARPYLVDYKVKPPLMQDPTDQPVCPSAVIEAKAVMIACQALFGSTGQGSWNQLAQTYNAQYQEELEQARHADARRVLSRNAVTRPARVLGQWDALFNSDHDMDCPP